MHLKKRRVFNEDFFANLFVRHDAFVLWLNIWEIALSSIWSWFAVR